MLPCRFCDIMVWVIKMENELQKRKPLRLERYDYNRAGAYFITICTQNKHCLLSRIVGTGVLDCPEIALTPYGKIADKYINQLNNFYQHISVDRYVIMPNHIHILLFVSPHNNLNLIENGQSRTPVPTGANSFVSQFVSTFKRFCNKEYGKNLWQSRFYDHIIRNQKDYEEHANYIHKNPLRWYHDELYTEE